MIMMDTLHPRVRLLFSLYTVAKVLTGGEGCIHIYSGSARLVSCEIKLISKEISRAEPEYMKIHTHSPN